MHGTNPGDLHLVLLHPEIPWNTGNAGRSCLAFGARLHLVEPLGFSLDASEVRRAGLDYWERVPREIHPGWEVMEARLEELGEPWFLSVEGPRTLQEVEPTLPCAFVLGCESRGLPASIRSRWRERLVRIPQRPGSVRSLNLSTVAALVLYEARRREGHGLEAGGARQTSRKEEGWTPRGGCC